MGLFDSFYAELACPNCGCQAIIEAQTKDFENAMLTFSIGQPVEPLTQAELSGVGGCRWCGASVEVPVLVREGHFVGFGEATLRAPQPIPLPAPPLKNPVKAGNIADAVRAVQARYPGEVYLGWDRGHQSVAIWHQGHWLSTCIYGTAEDTLRHLAQAEGEGAIQRRVQRIEAAMVRRAGADPHKRLAGWGLREIDQRYLQEVERTVEAVLQGIGAGFADLTVSAQGKLCLTADGTSAESMFHAEVPDTAACLLRDWVRAKAGIGQRFHFFRDDERTVRKTLERLERALGIAEGEEETSAGAGA